METSDERIECSTSEPINEGQQQTWFDERFWQVTTIILLLTKAAKLLFSLLFLCTLSDNFFNFQFINDNPDLFHQDDADDDNFDAWHLFDPDTVSTKPTFNYTWFAQKNCN